MPINTADFHQRNFRLTQAMGAKLNAGDATFAPVGYSGIHLLVKSFPHPFISGGQEIEVPMAGGGVYYEQSPIDPKFQGQVSFLETVAGTVRQFSADVVANGGFFDARIYEGTPERHYFSYMLERCFFTLDPADRDWESRTQVLMVSGTLRGMFFGRIDPGNI